MTDPIDDRVVVTFGRVFYTITTFLIIAAFFTVLIISANPLAAFAAAGFTTIGTSSGMVWRAQKVEFDDAN